MVSFKRYIILLTYKLFFYFETFKVSTCIDGWLDYLYRNEHMNITLQITYDNVVKSCILYVFSISDRFKQFLQQYTHNMEKFQGNGFNEIEASPILTRIHFVLWFLFVGIVGRLPNIKKKKQNKL